MDDKKKDLPTEVYDAISDLMKFLENVEDKYIAKNKEENNYENS